MQNKTLDFPHNHLLYNAITFIRFEWNGVVWCGTSTNWQLKLWIIFEIDVFIAYLERVIW